MSDLDLFRERVKHGTPIPVRCSGIHTESRRPCQMPAERLLFAGCVHEHIAPHFACSGHSGAVERGCADCWRAGHECPLAEIANPGVDIEAWLIEKLTPSNSAGIDQAEWREFVREHLHELVPVRLRTA